MRLCNHSYSGNAMSITYCECVFIALGIQCERRTRHIVNWACTFLQYFSTLSHKGHDLKKKVTGHEMRVLIFDAMFFFF